MIRSITRFAAFALVGGVLFAGAAQAENYPRVVGTGQNASVEYGPSPARNIVGGALTRSIGSGESRTIVTIEAQHWQSPQTGLRPVITGSGENLSVAYVAG